MINNELILLALKNNVNAYNNQYGSYDIGLKNEKKYNVNKVEWNTYEDEDTYWVAIQGSVEKEDWFDNFEFAKKQAIKKGWKFHSGFLEQALVIYKTIGYELLTKLKLGKNVIFSGHSLGGALARIMRMFLYDYTNIKVITNGEPRSMNLKAKLFCDKLSKDNTVRVRNENDFVTHVPFRFLQFFHARCKIDIGEKKNLIWLLLNFTKWKTSFWEQHDPNNYVKNFEKYML